MAFIFKYLDWVTEATEFFWEFPAHINDRLSLIRIAEQKFCRGYTTMELMGRAKSDAEKRRVAMVALLEVDASERYAGMRQIDIYAARKCHYLVRAFIAVKNPQAEVLSRGGSVVCRN